MITIYIISSEKYLRHVCRLEFMRDVQAQTLHLI